MKSLLVIFACILAFFLAWWLKPCDDNPKIVALLRAYQNPNNLLPNLVSDLLDQHEREFGERPTDSKFEAAVVNQFTKRMMSENVQGRLAEWDRIRKTGGVF